MVLDSRDPAIPLNYTVMLADMRNTGAATEQLRNFEQRVLKLRQSNLDADAEVLLTASKLSATIGHKLGISVNIKENLSTETQGRSRQAEMEREAKMRNKTARAALRAKSKEEATEAQPEQDSLTKEELEKAPAQTS